MVDPNRRTRGVLASRLAAAEVAADDLVWPSRSVLANLGLGKPAQQTAAASRRSQVAGQHMRDLIGPGGACRLPALPA
jgi:hypothetical protein